MNMQITERMKKWLGVETIKHNSYDLYAWHANFRVVGGKKIVVLMHNLTKFTIVLYPVKKKEMLNPDFILNVIYHALLNEGYAESLVRNYLNKRPQALAFKRTGERSFLTSLNMQLQSADDFAGMDGVFNDTNEQLHIGTAVNKILVKAVGRNDYMIPHQEMLEYLEGKPLPFDLN